MSLISPDVGRPSPAVQMVWEGRPACYPAAPNHLFLPCRCLHRLRKRHRRGRALGRGCGFRWRIDIGFRSGRRLLFRARPGAPMSRRVSVRFAVVRGTVLAPARRWGRLFGLGAPVPPLRGKPRSRCRGVIGGLSDPGPGRRRRDQGQGRGQDRTGNDCEAWNTHGLTSLPREPFKKRTYPLRASGRGLTHAMPSLDSALKAPVRVKRSKPGTSSGGEVRRRQSWAIELVVQGIRSEHRPRLRTGAGRARRCPAERRHRAPRRRGLIRDGTGHRPPVRKRAVGLARSRGNASSIPKVLPMSHVPRHLGRSLPAWSGRELADLRLQQVLLLLQRLKARLSLELRTNEVQIV